MCPINCRESNLVKVFITVDTEIWPDSPGWPHTPLAADNDCNRELSLYFSGGNGPDPLGVSYQLRKLADAGLKATYFVDPMFSLALGLAPLRDLISLIQEQDQEIGLHLHPEWLTDPRCAPLPRFSGPLLHQYSEADQSALIAAALVRLREGGARRVKAFRAGSWGANLATLRALTSHGIQYDSSLNGCFAVSFPDLRERRRYIQPMRFGEVWEFPVTSFIDWPPSSHRPLHVCAASIGEFRTVLEHAAADQWFAVVIVLHSFEFVRIGRVTRSNVAAPRRLVAGRFERLCAFLADNKERFQTCHFADLDGTTIPESGHSDVPVSGYARTGFRMAQQLFSRFY